MAFKAANASRGLRRLKDKHPTAVVEIS